MVVSNDEKAQSENWFQEIWDGNKAVPNGSGSTPKERVNRNRELLGQFLDLEVPCVSEKMLPFF